MCDRTDELVWRVDENLMDATIERQYAAIESLPELRRATEPEKRLRSIVLGSPEVNAHDFFALRAYRQVSVLGVQFAAPAALHPAGNTAVLDHARPPAWPMEEHTE